MDRSCGNCGRYECNGCDSAVTPLMPIRDIGTVPRPADAPPKYNGSGTPCDMDEGPCSCGARHKLVEKSELLQAAQKEADVKLAKAQNEAEVKREVIVKDVIDQLWKNLDLLLSGKQYVMMTKVISEALDRYEQLLKGKP